MNAAEATLVTMQVFIRPTLTPLLKRGKGCETNAAGSQRS